MDYLSLLQKIKIYKEKYYVKTLGKTIFNRDIFAVEINRSDEFATAILVASVHARENITTDLLCKFLDEGLFDNIRNFNVSFILMANPDGVELSKHGIISAPKKCQKKLIESNKNSLDFSLWKANGRGVDINNNFDANFGTNVGSFVPATSGFLGDFAESEIETKIIANYTREKHTFFTISYHTKGEEIYYNFFQRGRSLERDKIIAEQFEKSTGYKIRNVEKVSSGGYKDFCVMKLKIPAITIEVGDDSLEHPIGTEYLEDIFNRNKFVAKDIEFAYNKFIKFQGKWYGLQWKIYEKSY